MADARLPTGSDEDLTGSGHLSMRGLLLASSRLGDFAPHVNVGYVPLLTGFRRGERMRMQARQYYTAEMVRALPDDGNRYETVYGELLVSPSPRPRHQIVGARILAALFKYLESNPGPMVLYSPADLSFGRDDVLVQPDIVVLRPEDASFTSWDTVGRLLLAIEILSPSSARHDRFTKRRLYQELGADESRQGFRSGHT